MKIVAYIPAALLCAALAACQPAETSSQPETETQKETSMFTPLTDTIKVSPQITLDQVAAAKDEGVTLIINNRPDGEDPESPQSADIEAAAKAAGIDYIAIPVTHSGFSMPQVDAMIAALEKSEGNTLAYCRSGTRSTLLWALAQAKQGKNPASLSATAARAGYDLTPIRPMLDALSADAG